MTKAQKAMQLKVAAFMGSVTGVERGLLLGVTVKTATTALESAVTQGHTQCVKRLIPRSNPKWNNSWPLILASQIQHQEIFDLLYPVSNPKDALRYMKSQQYAPEDMSMLERRIMQDSVQQSVESRQKNTMRKM